MGATRTYERVGIRRLALTGVAVGVSAAYVMVSGALLGAAQNDRAFQLTLPAATTAIVSPQSPDEKPTVSYTQADIEKIKSTPGVANVSGFANAPITPMKSATVPYLGAATAFINGPTTPQTSGQISVDSTTANDIGIARGDQLLIRGWNGDVKEFTVGELTADGAAPVASSGAVFGMSTADFMWSVGPASVHTLLVTTTPGANQGAVDAALVGQSHGGSVLDHATWANKQPAPDAKGPIYFYLAVTAFAVICVAVSAVTVTLRASLASRMREAGLLRAIGASGQHLRGILMRQALIVGTVASVAGVALGYAAAEFASLIIQATGGLALATPAWPVAVVGLFVGILVTLMGVMRPAVEAARTSPIEAVTDAEVSSGDLVGVKLKARLANIALVGIGLLCLAVSTAPGAFPVGVAGAVLLCKALSRSAPTMIGSVTRLLPWRKTSTVALASRSLQRTPVKSTKLVALVGNSSTFVAVLLLALAAIIQFQAREASVENQAMVVVRASESQRVESAVEASSPMYSVTPGDVPGTLFVHSTSVDSEAKVPGLVQDVDRVVADVPGAVVFPASEAGRLQPNGYRSLNSAIQLVISMIIGTLILTGVAFASASASGLRARTAELGVLRAISMTRRRMIRMLTAEGVLLAVVGLIGGAVIAVATVAFSVHLVSFGAFAWGLLAAMVAGGTVIAATASFIPPWRMIRSVVMSASGLD